MPRLVRFLFGCSHKRLSFPVRNRQTCLDCADLWPYDFKNLGFQIQPPRLTQPVQKLDAITTLMARERRIGIARVK